MSDNEPFHGDTLLYSKIEQLVKEFKIQSIFESGTGHGITSVALSTMAPTHTVERDYNLYRNSRHLDTVPNLTRHVGISYELMKELDLKPMTLYYLNGIGSFTWPVRRELMTITRPSVIVIPHYHVPELNDPLLEGSQVYWLNIKNEIERIFPLSYHKSTNTESTGEQIGVLFITP